jgi:hypothetical protein
MARGDVNPAAWKDATGQPHGLAMEETSPGLEGQVVVAPYTVAGRSTRRITVGDTPTIGSPADPTLTGGRLFINESSFFVRAAHALPLTISGNDRGIPLPAQAGQYWIGPEYRGPIYFVTSAGDSTEILEVAV